MQYVLGFMSQNSFDDVTKCELHEGFVWYVQNITMYWVMSYVFIAFIFQC